MFLFFSGEGGNLLKYDRFFCLAAFLIIINIIIVQRCTAHSEIITLGNTWTYVIRLNGQPFRYNQITVIDEERIQGGKVWTIKNEYVYRVRLNKNHIDEYQGQTIIKLRDDFTLVSLSDTIKRNGSDFSVHSFTFKEEEKGYFFREIIAEEKSEGFIRTKTPLYLYGYTYPWLIEVLVRNSFLTPQKPCSAISFFNEIISIKHLGDLSLTSDQNKYVCYMANNDKIYLNKNKDVVKIDSEKDGCVEFMYCEDFPEEELCYDLEMVMGNLTSNVLFIKSDALTSVTAYLNLRLGLESADYLQRPSARQNFTGAVFQRDDEITIEGEVAVHKAIAEPKAPFAFPVTIKWGSEFDKYLISQSLVEVNAPEIKAKAEEITKEAKNTWEAASAIARWVYEHIEYNGMFGDLSARETLQEGKGVCGQFALLTTALCRAVKIPVRFVTGYAYSHEKRAFVLHAWVEVYTDKNGWKSMDPTWGQFDFLDATHIGLSDHINISVDISSLRPRIIRVLSYTPEEAGPMAPPALNIGALKIKGEELHYEIFEREKKVGDYTGKINIVPGGNYCLTETLTIPHSTTKSQSELLMDDQGYILSYKTDGLWEGLKLEREFIFAEDLKFKATYGEEQIQTETHRLLAEEIQVDLLRLMQWGLLAARLIEGVETEITKTVTVFVADIPEYRNLEATLRPCTIDFDGFMDTGWFCVISGSRLRKELYITKDGVLTRIDLPEIHLSAVLAE